MLTPLVPVPSIYLQHRDPKGPKTIPDQLDFATGVQGAAKHNQEFFFKAHRPHHTSGAGGGCKAAKPRSQKLKYDNRLQISILQLLPKLSQARAGRNLPAPAGLHLPPRTRRFKKPPLEFNPNKFLAGSSTAGRDAAQGRSESQELLLVKSFSLWVRRDNKGANHRSSFAILSQTRPVHPALLVKGLKSRGRPRSRRGKICQWCI